MPKCSKHGKLYVYRLQRKAFPANEASRYVRRPGKPLTNSDMSCPECKREASSTR